MMSGEVGKAHEEESFITNDKRSPKNVNNDLGKGITMPKSMDEYNDLREELYMLKKYLKALAGIVVVGIVTLIIVVTILYSRLDKGLKTHTHHVAPKVGENITRLLERQEVCFPCHQIRLGPSSQEENMLNSFRRRPGRKTSEEECCIETASQLVKLFKLFVEKRFLEEKARGKINLHTVSSDASNQRTTSAHLMGPRIKLTEGVGRDFPMSNWTDVGGLAFRTNDVIYRYGRLVVPADGMYYIYSQVSFLEYFDSPTRNQRSGSPSLSHYLYRYNVLYQRGGEEILLQNSLTKCCSEGKAFAEYSSYLGAVFHLRREDEIFVKVSNLSILSLDPNLNYFGLFRV